MHDIKIIRKNPDIFLKKLSERNAKIDIKSLLDLDKKNRELIQNKEKLEQEKKIISQKKDKNLFNQSKEDPRDQKYDETVSLAAVAEGEQVYRSSILYWIDKLKASEMQGPYYFEALKSFLSSEYRECELKICSVEDRKDQRLSVRKPHFSGAKGDIGQPARRVPRDCGFWDASLRDSFGNLPQDL